MGWWIPQDRDEEEQGLCVEMSDADGVLHKVQLAHTGNRETVELLLRGMPIPACYGLPDTDGTLTSCLWQFIGQLHPLVSVFQVHWLHPFTWTERLCVYLCTLAFNALFELRARRTKHFLVPETGKFGYWVAKHVWTILYAVVIRVLVICPCCVKVWEDSDVTDAVVRLVRSKRLGNRLIVSLLAAHLAALAVSMRHAGVQFARAVLVSELITFYSWYFKFVPYFLVLFPIQRAIWFQGGSLTDYLLCRRQCCTYQASPNFIDKSFPRAVRPATPPCDDPPTVFFKLTTAQTHLAFFLGPALLVAFLLLVRADLAVLED